MPVFSLRLSRYNYVRIYFENSVRR